MNKIMKLKSFAVSSLGLKTGAILVAAIAAVLVAAPRFQSVSKAESCPNPPDHAVLNYWPVSFDATQTGCTDYTTVDGHLVSGGSYSTSQADYDNGLQMGANDEAYIRTYVHNGAAQNGDPAKTTAKNVQLDLNVATGAGTDHSVTASWHGDNTNTASGTFVLHTPANTGIQIEPNSGELYDAFGHLLASNIDVSSGHYTLGDQNACYEFARFLRFKVKTVTITPTGNPALSITKQVRNVTQNNTLSSSTVANTGDTVAYQIKVTNTGNATASNVTVTDTGTSGTQFTAGTLTTTVGTGSSIPGTINVGTLTVGQTVTIDYRSTVTGGAGTYVNTATAQATSVSPVTAQATVVVNQIIVNNNTTISITKQVRNITTGTGFASSVNASTGNTVQYQIVIRNTGSNTARSITLNDTGTSGTQFVAGSMTVTQGSTSSIPGTMSLGDLAVGGSITVTYNATVTGGAGSYVNTATASASNAPSVSAQATVIVTQVNTFKQIAIDKQVRNLNSSSTFQNSVSANSGDRVQFRIVITNTGNDTVTNVTLSDPTPSNLIFDTSSITVDGSLVGNSSVNPLNLGTMTAGQQKTITFNATVNTASPCTGATSIQNIARATGDGVSQVQDDAFVTVSCVQGSNINLVFSKKAWNDTKNVDATSTNAAREDYITYTLTVTNTGNADATNFVITDDLSGVLPYADYVDNGQGGTLSGNVISFPAVTVPAGGSVSKTFRVRIKFSLSQSLTYQLRNTYGNTVLINVGSVLGASTFVAPVTGVNGGQAALAFGGLLTLAFIAFKKRAFLKRLILA